MKNMIFYDIFTILSFIGYALILIVLSLGNISEKEMIALAFATLFCTIQAVSLRLEEKIDKKNKEEEEEHG